MGMNEGFVQLPFLFVAAVDIVTELARQGVLSDLLNADDLVLMNKTIEGHKNKFLKRKQAFQNKDWNIIHENNQCNGQRQHHKGYHF